MSWSGGTTIALPSRAAVFRTAPVIAFVLLAMSLTGCARLGLPFGGAPRPDASITNSLKRTSLPSDPSDWEAVRRALATSLERGDAAEVEWTNPDTGATGVISVVSPVATRGSLCRMFDTTLSDVRGVRRYRGEACREASGRWNLVDVTAADSRLS